MWRLLLVSAFAVLVAGMRMPHLSEDAEEALVQRVMARVNATLHDVAANVDDQNRDRLHQRRAVEGVSGSFLSSLYIPEYSFIHSPNT